MPAEAHGTQAHKIKESVESARVPGMTPLFAGSLPESLPASMLRSHAVILTTQASESNIW